MTLGFLIYHLLYLRMCLSVTDGVEGTVSVNISGSGSFSGYLSRHDSADIQTEKGEQLYVNS